MKNAGGTTPRSGLFRFGQRAWSTNSCSFGSLGLDAFRAGRARTWGRERPSRSDKEEVHEAWRPPRAAPIYTRPRWSWRAARTTV